MNFARVAFLIVVGTISGPSSLLYGGPLSYGSAEILWASLEVTADPGLTLMYDKYTSRSSVDGSSVSLNQQKDNWTEETSLTHQTTESDHSLWGLATSLTGSIENLYAEASASSDTLAGAYSITSTAQRFAFFHAVGSGNVRVGVQYRLSSTLQSDLGNQAAGHSLAYLQISNLSNYEQSREVLSIGSDIRNVGSDSDSVEGWIYTDHSFVDGDEGHFQIWAQSHAAASSPIETPESASITLLVIGLIALAVCRKTPL